MTRWGNPLGTEFRLERCRPRSTVSKNSVGTQSVITHTCIVAGGRYAPGHVGEFTQDLPFEALAATKITQARAAPFAFSCGGLPAAGRLPACLNSSTCGAWRKLTAALEGLPIATPTVAGCPPSPPAAPMMAMVASCVGPAPPPVA